MGYGLYIAAIIGVCSNTDSRLQVRILPQMTDIDASECPLYPYFFKDELFTGKEGDLVWCICDNEFNIGYILGLANYTTYTDDTYTTTSIGNKDINLSLPVDLKNKINQAGINLRGKALDFNDIKVTHWNDTSIHFVERSTGGLIIAYAVGSMLIMRPNEFYVHIGSERAGSGTSLKMDIDGIGISGPAIKLQSESIGLGNNPVGKVLITNGASAEAATTSKYVEA